MRRRADSPFLSLQLAIFRLGDRLVFPHSSWIFRQNEHWAALGGNGSGKSLFGDAVRGVLPLVGGELKYYFRPPPGVAAEQAIGHVSFDERRLEVHDTVVQSRWNSLEQEGLDRVEEFLSYERVLDINPFEVTHGRKAERRRFARRLAKAVGLLELGPLLNKRLLTLSNGERQRVQLARALCQPLRLLILDEPFAGLDVRARQHFRFVLEELMKTPLRVLLLTTRPEDLPRQITHALWLEGCRLVRAGPIGAERIRESGKQRTKVYRQELSAKSGCPSRDSCHQELLRLDKVTVRYGTTTILDNINWTVRAGESWALLGPNGAGKTTLLSLVLGDNPQAYRNEVCVFGHRRGPGESLWEIKRRIGSISPELQVHFDASLSCFEVVASGFFDTIGLFEPLTAHQRRAVRRWLRAFDLQGFAQAPLFSLSAGLQRMALLARALVKQPRLLLLDEPCQGLDQSHREFFLDRINRLVGQGGVTIIYVSHRADEIPSAITRVMRLDRGKQV